MILNLSIPLNLSIDENCDFMIASQCKQYQRRCHAKKKTRIICPQISFSFSSKPYRMSFQRISNQQHIPIVTSSLASTNFTQSYISLCHIQSLPLSSCVLSASLDTHNSLTVDLEKLKKDEDYGPLLKALRKDASLNEIHFFSNEGIPYFYSSLFRRFLSFILHEILFRNKAPFSEGKLYKS